mgnify:FL=1
MNDNKCGICGEENNEYLHTLKCNHTFHYQCLFLSFKNDLKYRHCPYCRSQNNLLPIVSGVKKVHPKIHDYSDTSLLNKKCDMVLKRGKNKGEKCSKNCRLGYNYCGIHLKQVKKNDL